MNRVTIHAMTSVFIFLCLPVSAFPEVNPQLQQLIESLQSAAVKPFAADAGLELWHRKSNGRSCTSCHTDDPDADGRHEQTGKLIEPMSPSINPMRLTRIKKINKWLLRNCKWTFGRECTAQEKGDFLLWLSQQ